MGIDRKAGSEYTMDEDILHSTTGELDPGLCEQAASLGRRFDRHFLLGVFALPFTSNGKPAVPSNRKAWRVFI